MRKFFPRKGTFPSPIQQDPATGLAMRRAEVLGERKDPFAKVAGTQEPAPRYVNLDGLAGFIVA